MDIFGNYIFVFSGQGQQPQTGSDSSEPRDRQHLVRDEHHDGRPDGRVAEAAEAQVGRGAEERGGDVPVARRKRSLREGKRKGTTKKA